MTPSVTAVSAARTASAFVARLASRCLNFAQEFEQLHQAWPWSGLARFGPTTPTRAGRLADASVDPTEARKTKVADSSRASTNPARLQEIDDDRRQGPAR